MALRAGYKGFKKLLAPLKIIRPGTLGIDNDVLIPELNKTFFPRSEQAKTGATNIIPFPYYDGDSITVGTVVFTVDGYDVKANGVNGNDYPQYRLCTATQLNNLLDKYGDLFVSGCPSGGSSDTYQIYTQRTGVTLTDRGEGMWISADYTYTTGINIQIRPNYNANNVVFKPMISLSDKNPYTEPVMTNKELTDVVSGLIVKSFNIPSLEIAAEGYATTSVNIAVSGLVPLGVISYTLGGNGNTSCSLFRMFVDPSNSDNLLIGVSNHASGAADISIGVVVLYKGIAS